MWTKRVRKGKLTCKVFPTRDEMGQEAAKEVAEKIRELLAEQEEINMVFAAAPSQNDVLKHLLTEDVDWSKVNAFHMDEYIGLEDKFEKTFAYYLKTTIFDKVPLHDRKPNGWYFFDSFCFNFSVLLIRLRFYFLN